MLVLKVTDPAATVARIEEAVRARKSSVLRTFGGWTGWTGCVLSVAFSPDGQTIASGTLDNNWHKTIVLWDIASGKSLRTLKGHKSAVNSVAFSPDGRILASGSADDTIKLWDIASGKELRTLTGHTNSVLSAAFSPDGRILASSSGYQATKPWEILTTPVKLALAMKKSGGRDQPIKLWDIASGKELRTLSGHTDPVSSVAFCPDGQFLASGSVDTTIKIRGMK